MDEARVLVAHGVQAGTRPADLSEVELYSERWQLASFEYGSGLEVGASLTVRVENGEVQPISMDDIELTAPDIDPVAMARGLISEIA